MIIVIMGVCGSGKSTVGEGLARELKINFEEGDDFHPEANVNKMSKGEPLTELEREPWLKSIRRIMDHSLEKGRGLVITCSALSQKSRNILGTERDDVLLVYLHAPQSVLEKRMAERKNHFMPPELLRSQLDILEKPYHEEALHVSVDKPLPDIITYILRTIRN